MEAARKLTEKNGAPSGFVNAEKRLLEFKFTLSVPATPLFGFTKGEAIELPARQVKQSSPSCKVHKNGEPLGLFVLARPMYVLVHGLQDGVLTRSAAQRSGIEVRPASPIKAI